MNRVIKFMKEKASLFVIAFLFAALAGTLVGTQPIDTGSASKSMITLDSGGQDIITIGHESYAAGDVDYTFGATNADVQFQDALDDLPATGGRLVCVSAVQVNWTAGATVTRAIDNVIIEGSGRGTYFVGDGVTSPFTAGGDNWVFTNIRVDVNAATLLAAMGATTGWMWTNVATTDTYYAYRSPYGQSVFNDATVASLTDSGLTATRVPIAGAGGLLSDDADLTFSGTTLTVTDIAAPVGRAATFTVVASNADAQSIAQADYVCDGTDDQVEIQAAIEAIVTTGNRGSVKLIGDTFNCTTQLVARSNVDVDGSFAEVILNTNNNGCTVLFDSITNSVWRNLVLRRQGIPVAVNQQTVSIEGTTDDTCMLMNCRLINDTTGTKLSKGLAIIETAYPIINNCQIYGSTIAHSSGTFIGGYTQVGGDDDTPHPRLYNCYSKSRGVGNSNNSGFDIDQSSYPELFDCVGESSNDGDGSGINIHYRSHATLMNCIGIGGSYDAGSAVGITIGREASPTLIGCKGIGTAINKYCHGIVVIGSATPTLIGCSGEASPYANAYALVVFHASSPTITGFQVYPKRFNYDWVYDDADNGRFQPFAGYDYQLVGMWVQVRTADAGVTLDLGTSIGGSDIVSDIPLDALGDMFYSFTRAELGAGTYIYATPSAAVADEHFNVFYSVIVNYADSYALRMQTNGYARISDSTFVSNGASDTLFITSTCSKNWEISNTTFETLDPTNQYSVHPDGAMSDLPINGCRLKGKIHANVTSFAQNTYAEYSDLFMDVLAASANYIVNVQNLVDGAVALTGTQPTYPRGLDCTITEVAGNVTDYTLTVVGTDAKGQTITDIFTFADDGLAFSSDNAFDNVTSVTLADVADTGTATFVMGIDTRLGLQNVIYQTSDVWKIIKNGTKQTVAVAQVDVDYDIYDMSVITVAATDDFTIW